MGEDFEGMYDLSSMDDGEIRALIREQLEDYPELDVDRVDVAVVEGRVTLGGRVGTEQEYQAIEHVVTDVLGISEVHNDLVVDALTRGEQADAADDALAERMQNEGLSSGGASRTEDSAEHLLTDTAAEQFGTRDMGEAIERGYSYNPPDSPVQEGSISKENH
ncbi:MAG TPA: BON domain-containing protein [Longimicrobiales bacterium]|nr:BON domain-containing protein [Longimicrobiales bacterium]